ncbi:MAG: sigma 54-interacting transcriptional regulator [Polyangiaceae bacterium]
MGTLDDSTLPPVSLTSSGVMAGISEALGLVLVWAREEAGRAGEVLLFRRGEQGERVFGREDRGADSRSVVRLVRQRPGENEPAAPVTSPRISRAQLRFRGTATGDLVVQNIGKNAMLHEGREVSEATLRAGDLLEIRHEMIFLCARRPAAIGRVDDRALHAFGGLDEHGIAGEGPAAWELRRTLALVARRPVHTLILGESGTGKELAARAIHALSGRAKGPFVGRNAATLPEALLDAELFGQAKNYPNPGSPERGGLIGEAEGGTLFLDEIGELPESLQAHLLRLLDSGEYHRLGEGRARRADIRFLGATNRAEASLKHDVHARLAARITVPGLGLRREDIPILTHHLIRRQALSDPQLADRVFPGGDPSAAPRVAPELMTALLRHEYRTNLRELDAVLLVATMEGRGKYVGLTEGAKRLLAARTEAVETGSLVEGGARGEADARQRSPFSEEEQRRLDLQRAHGFRAAACAADPRYGGNRQSADFHLRHLMARALRLSDYDVGGAERLLGGEDAHLRERIRDRLARFLDNLTARRDEVGREALRQSLSAEWRGSAQVALDLLAAIEAGAVRRTEEER